MPVIVRCPNTACGTRCSVPEASSGGRVKCPSCGKPFVVRPTIDGRSVDTSGSESAPTGDPFPVLPAEFGRYRVLRLLGKGGMGAVYLAQDSQLRRHVAIKLPFFGPAESSQRLERFIREARSAAVLHHPNICTVFDAGQIEGRPFITMAYVPGKPLASEIDPESPMPQRRAAEIARKVALALEHAHRNGTVHRDLKPANVMITADGEPVVMDFGLAKQANEGEPNEAKLTRDGGIVGTPSYMSPEQVRGDAIGPATDVYSLGGVLFEMLTARTPYSGRITAMLGQILAAPVPSAREFRPEIDPRLDAICQKALAKDPADRFADMGEFAEALGRFLKPSPPPPLPAQTTSDSTAPALLATVDGSPFEGLDEETISRPKKKARWGRAVAAILGLAFLAPLGGWLAMTVLRVETADGTLVVEIDDREVDARFKSGRLILSGPDGKVRYTLSPDERNKTLKAGPYKVRVEGADGLVLNTTEFKLKKSGRVTVRVSAVATRKLGATGETFAGKKTEDLAEWVPLLNGKDLSGWISDGNCSVEEWKVVGGEVSIKGGDQRGWGFLLTRQEFADFGLRLQFLQESEGAKSGVVLRGVLGSRIGGLPFQCKVNLEKPENTGAFLWSTQPNYHNPSRAAKLKPVGEWNDLELNLVEQKLRVTVNGDCIQSLDLDEFAAKPAALPALKHAAGRIGLQKHAGNVRFRKIEIKAVNPQSREARVSAPDPDRKAAEYVLSIGGVVRVNDEVDDVKRALDLPSTPFRLTLVNLKLNPNVRNAAMAVFDGCRHLETLVLHRVPVKDQGAAHFKDCKRLKSLELVFTEMTAAGMAVFQDCNELDKLNLQGPNVTDANLATFKNCDKIKLLVIAFTQVRGPGLIAFKECKQLEQLNISSSRIPDEYLSVFSDCRNLTGLHLGSSQYQGSALRYFKECKKLKSLDLNELPNLTDASLAPCENFTSLETLSMRFTPQIGSAGLAHFRNCKELKEVNLERTQVGDDALGFIKSWRNLSHINLRGTKVTKAGVESLKQALPSCGIDWSPNEVQAQTSTFLSQDLSNWDGLIKNHWQYKDGELVGRTGPNGVLSHTFLCSKKKYTDFDISFQVKLKEGTSNSGVQIRSTLVDRSTFRVTGPQCGIGPGYWGCLWGEGVGNEKIRAASRDAEAAVKEGEFNDYYIKCVGKHLTIKLNGFTAVDEVIETMPSEGIIAFQLHHGKPTEVTFKRIRFRDLSQAVKQNEMPSSDPDRKAAEYVISIGGVVRVNNEVDDIRVVADLPRRAFRLTYVDLTNNQKVRNSALIPFSGCTHLKTLKMGMTQLKDEGLEYFKGCKDLETIELTGAPVGDQGLAYLKGCKRLKILELGRTGVTDKGLANFNGCTELTVLKLHDMRVSDDGLGYFKECTKLETLILVSVQVTDIGLDNFKACKGLKLLDLGHTRVRGHGLTAFKDCSQLENLGLHSTGVGNAGLAHFKNCKNLMALHLQSSQVDDAGLMSLAEYKELRFLSLGGTRVGNRGVAYLQNCVNLRELFLPGNEVGDEGLTALKHLKLLKRLSLFKTTVTPAGVAELQKALPNCGIECR